MMTGPASAIKKEAFELIELQIDALRREGGLTASDLADYHTRSEKITRLYRELDRMAMTNSRIKFRSTRAS
ncbi:MAG: hypothetical protein LAP86_10810 [Acidobacteriia bacterium]|nr:hypothetical protein [Terriglobia bacterium]